MLNSINIPLGYPFIGIRSPLEFLKDETKEVKAFDSVAFCRHDKKTEVRRDNSLQTGIVLN